MNTSRDVLARQAAARLIAAACKEQGDVWSHGERLHVQATRREQAQAAADPLLRICRGCPIVAECRRWATIDRYTGIAAGVAWVNGQPRPPDWVARGPLQRLAG